MELTYHGANCLKISTKKVTIVVDDNLADLGAKSVTKEGDVALFTHGECKSDAKTKLCIDQPGEYEVADVSVQGVAAQAHMDDTNKQAATIYKLTHDYVTVVVLGHVAPKITDEELENLGHVDVLIVPVGGHGYTLDGVGALEVIKKIEPRIIIPTHYGDKSLKYEVPQDELEEAIKGLAMEPKEAVDKIKLKAAELPENLQLVILNKQ